MKTIYDDYKRKGFCLVCGEPLFEETDKRDDVCDNCYEEIRNG